MKAWRGALVGSLVALGFGCGSDPVPVTGQAYWKEGCLVSPSGANCNTNNHAVHGSAGSPNVDIECSVVPATTGNFITFRIAAVEAGQNFADSQEGLFVEGLLDAVGSELRVGDDGGFLQIRGSGWSVPPANGTIGVTGACHVFVDRLNGQNFNGRIHCDNVVDDETPARLRFVAGQAAQTADPNFAEFSFTNCDNH